MEETTQTTVDATQVTDSNEAEMASAPDESIVEEAVDWVEHESALAMFKANQGLAWIKTKMHDGVIRMIGRNGETQ